MKFENAGVVPILRGKDGRLEERQAYRVLDDGRLLGYAVRIDSAVTGCRYWLVQPGEAFETDDGRHYLMPMCGFSGAVHLRRAGAARWLALFHGQNPPAPKEDD